MEVSFTPELERFIDERVSQGEYPTREDVVRAGVDRMRQDDAELERVRALVQAGIDSADRGELYDGEEVMRELHDRLVRMVEEPGAAV